MKKKIVKKHCVIAVLCLPFWLASCAVQAPPGVGAAVPSHWYGPLPASDGEITPPLPHNGSSAELSQWWRERGDPLLVDMIEAAQAVSPSIASARSRIEQARAVRVASGAALLPTLDGSLNASRSNAQVGIALGTALTAGAQTAWEIDIFGANRGSRDAAQARLDASQAGWHDARVAVAVEVANRYYSRRSCDMLLDVTRFDAASRAETAHLADLSAQAGFQAPATTALARASAAEGNSRVTQQRALCDLDTKALVALTAWGELDLRQKMATARGDLPQAAFVPIATVPAATLAQRPDVFSAEREVAAASAEVGSAQAQRFPRLSLGGSIGVTTFRGAGVTTDLATWSIGPLALTLPLFDGGKRAANVDAAQARYDEAVAKYHGSVRQAVREVEEALVNLQSTAARSDDARVAVDGYRASFNGTESRYQSGLASLVELEETRRTRLAAEIALVSLQRDRVAAWIALYRAAGGGWRADAADAPALRSAQAARP